MILATGEYKEKMKKDLEQHPVRVQVFDVQQSNKEKYLGIMVTDGGSRKTVRRQMEFRNQECKIIAMIKNMITKPTMR